MTVLGLLDAAGVEVHTRDDWASPQQAAGAYARRRGTHPMFVEKARYGFLHVTVTPDTDTIPEGAAGARKIETYGYSTPPMVSYQLLVTNEGRVYEGQNFGVKGTHTINDKAVPGFPRDLNGYGYAVALMQNVGDEVTDEQVDVVAMCFAAMKIDGEMERDAPILPHLKFANKACPGPLAMARLPEIRTLTEQYVVKGLPVPQPLKDTRVSLARKDVRVAVQRLNKAIAKGRDDDPQVKAFRKALKRALAEAPDR